MKNRYVFGFFISVFFGSCTHPSEPPKPDSPLSHTKEMEATHNWVAQKDYLYVPVHTVFYTFDRAITVLNDSTIVFDFDLRADTLYYVYSDKVEDKIIFAGKYMDFYSSYSDTMSYCYSKKTYSFVYNAKSSHYYWHASAHSP
jgi:hypothetical protein